MQKKLVPSGTGWELYMPKDLLKLLGFNPANTKVMLKIEKDKLKIFKTDSDNPDLLIKKFSKSGNGYGLYLSNSIIQLLDINPEVDKVRYEIDKDILIITKTC